MGGNDWKLSHRIKEIVEQSVVMMGRRQLQGVRARDEALERIKRGEWDTERREKV